MCYTQEMSETLERLSPSLRVVFAGLAKLSFERARNGPIKLPKPGKNKAAKRGKDTWTLVPGHIMYMVWDAFTEEIGLKGAKQRERCLCFLYSVMCVVDGGSDEGRVKEKNLPFEGFLEAIVRLGGSHLPPPPLTFTRSPSLPRLYSLTSRLPCVAGAPRDVRAAAHGRDAGRGLDAPRAQREPASHAGRVHDGHGGGR